MKILRPLLLLLLAIPALLPAQTPAGDEIRVATNAISPDIAMSPQGTFAVAWLRPLGSAGESVAAFARLYNADGSPRTGEIQVSGKIPRSALRTVRLAMMHDGSFVVVYMRGDRTLVARRFAASGAPLTGSFPVAQMDFGITAFAVGSRGDGSFVVVWLENHQRAFARVFGTGNEPLGPEIEVWRGNPNGLRVAVGPDGSFLVLWSDIQGSSGTGHFEVLLARVFTADGAPRGESFPVLVEPPRGPSFNAYDTAVDVDGRFLVTWFQAPDTLVRRYAPDGAPLGGPAVAGHRPAGGEIAGDPAGGFVSVWRGSTPITDVVARRFSASGSPRGPMVPLSQRARMIGIDPPRLAASGTGSFAAVWEWYGRIGRDSFGSAISVRRFRTN